MWTNILKIQWIASGPANILWPTKYLILIQLVKINFCRQKQIHFSYLKIKIRFSLKIKKRQIWRSKHGISYFLVSSFFNVEKNDKLLQAYFLLLYSVQYKFNLTLASYYEFSVIVQFYRVPEANLIVQDFTISVSGGSFLIQ